jgi:hypothetical protein
MQTHFKCWQLGYYVLPCKGRSFLQNLPLGFSHPDNTCFSTLSRAVGLRFACPPLQNRSAVIIRVRNARPTRTEWPTDALEWNAGLKILPLIRSSEIIITMAACSRRSLSLVLYLLQQPAAYHGTGTVSSDFTKETCALIFRYGLKFGVFRSNWKPGIFIFFFKRGKRLASYAAVYQYQPCCTGKLKLE